MNYLNTTLSSSIFLDIAWFNLMLYPADQISILMMMTTILMSPFYLLILLLTSLILTYNDKLLILIHMIRLRLPPSNSCLMTAPPWSNQIFLIGLLITLMVNPSSFITTNVMSLKISLSNVKLLCTIMMYQLLAILASWNPIMLYTSTIGGLVCEPSSKITSKVAHIASNSK